MIAFILYILAAFGFAFIVGFAKISLPLREWIMQTKEVVKYDLAVVGGTLEYVPRFGRGAVWFVALLECPACLGFWLGVFAALADRWFGFIALASLTDAPRLFSVIFLGCVVSACNFILGVFTRLIEVR